MWNNKRSYAWLEQMLIYTTILENSFILISKMEDKQSPWLINSLLFLDTRENCTQMPWHMSKNIHCRQKYANGCLKNRNNLDSPFLLTEWSWHTCEVIWPHKQYFISGLPILSIGLYVCLYVIEVRLCHLWTKRILLFPFQFGCLSFFFLPFHSFLIAKIVLEIWDRQFYYL